jgi:Predicted oxidoreductase
MRIAGTMDRSQLTAEREAAGRRAVLAAWEAGYTHFDHADIYGNGLCEEIFGRVLREVPGMRERILVATKCGIRWQGDPVPAAPHRWDFSRGHIMSSCEASLRRLGVERIDLYLLHRPDYLAEPDEIAAAFSDLRRQGKVREFGVSNFRPSYLSMIRAACPMPLVAHQVEISLARLDGLEDGTLEQCLEHGITPTAWSPLARGLLGDGGRADPADARAAGLGALLGGTRRDGEAPRREPHGAVAGLAAQAPGRHRAHRRQHRSGSHPGRGAGRRARAGSRGLVHAPGRGADAGTALRPRAPRWRSA